MCGIVGIFSDSEKNKERVVKSLEKIVHRGSSNFEYINFGNSYIGANRLPIQGRSSGFQPISNEEGNIRACQNGEIFNYAELRKELESKGHIFKTDCDTEIWVHLYEEYGIDAVKKIDSEMFACIIFDTKNNHIYVCRDLLGVKPLYYANHNDGTIHFASEMKQLVAFDDIQEIFNFPVGNYFYDGEFTKYENIENYIKNDKIYDEGEAIDKLTNSIFDAVKKRVNTDLPIGVFLSGGVDSSLVMEIACRLHNDVTAIILGKPGSSDLEYALKLCHDRKYKYHIVTPDDEYRKTIDDVMYYCETYEPLIIRHAFANDMCSKIAQQLGLKIVLVGEGADELFAGYNEFSGLSHNIIDEGTLKLTNDLGNGHLKRVDRLAMKYTVEVRCPLLDNRVIQTAFEIDSSLKIQKKNHTITVKYILRRVAEQFLPRYITWRYKMPFANGAGMNVGNNYKKSDGDIASFIDKKGDFLDKISEEDRKKFGITNNHEAYHLYKYNEFGYKKLHDSEKRIIVKDVVSTLEKSNKSKFLIAEFDFLPLYFPVYYAKESGIFDIHNLDIDFLSTKGDYETYFTLTNNTAQIGLSDPLFSMIKNSNNIYGKIVGELIDKNPLVAVTINPNIKIQGIEEIKKYKVGSYKQFSTAHTFSQYITDNNALPYEKENLTDALVNREIDIGIMLWEDALEIEKYGGKIIHSFEDYDRYCFTGFTVTNILPNNMDIQVKGFITSIKESIRYIKRDTEKAFIIFEKTFPKLRNKRQIFDKYLSYWKDNLAIDEYNTRNSYNIWKKTYPDMMNNFQGILFKGDKIYDIINLIKNSNYKKDHPYLEEKLYDIIKQSDLNGQPIPFFMFWGSSNKNEINDADIKTLDYLKKFCDLIGKEYKNQIKINIILADEHGLNNGYKDKDIIKYYDKLIPNIKKRGFEYIYLSEIYKKYKFKREIEIKKFIGKQTNGRWDEISIRGELEKTAISNYNGLDKLIGSQRYFALRTLEKLILEDYFKGQIFITYSNSKHQIIFPNMPTIYNFTSKKGYSELPRFDIN